MARKHCALCDKRRCCGSRDCPERKVEIQFDDYWICSQACYNEHRAEANRILTVMAARTRANLRQWDEEEE